VTFDVQRNFQIGDRIFDICPLTRRDLPRNPRDPAWTSARTLDDDMLTVYLTILWLAQMSLCRCIR
jgi:hypothetical protein